MEIVQTLHWTLGTKIQDMYVPNIGRSEGHGSSWNYEFWMYRAQDTTPCCHNLVISSLRGYII
jgi:hypothetical protein